LSSICDSRLDAAGIDPDAGLSPLGGDRSAILSFYGERDERARESRTSGMRAVRNAA
jgi:hypothetical protein